MHIGHYMLALAALLSFIAALLHIAIVFKGAAWYRFFGAGEQMARASEKGRWYPGIVTTGIAAVLMFWAAYALSAGGFITALPLLKPALVVITSVYLLRGVAVFPALVFAREQVTSFVWWSSLVCLFYGLVHLAGLLLVWSELP